MRRELVYSEISDIPRTNVNVAASETNWFWTKKIPYFWGMWSFFFCWNYILMQNLMNWGKYIKFTYVDWKKRANWRERNRWLCTVICTSFSTVKRSNFFELNEWKNLSTTGIAKSGLFHACLGGKIKFFYHSKFSFYLPKFSFYQPSRPVNYK